MMKKKQNKPNNPPKWFITYMNKFKKNNRKPIGDTLTVSRVKKPGGRGPKGPKDPTLRELIISLQKDVKNIQETLKRNNIV